MGLILEEAGAVAPFDDESTIVGEDLGMDIDRQTARHVNWKIRTEPSENVHINLGELGEHNLKDVRFRDSLKKGFLTAYVRTREAAPERKTVTTIAVSTIALGAVLSGIAAIKYRK